MGDSRSQSRRLSLRAPLSPSPYIFIIPHFCGFVKRFSKKFATFLEKAFIQEKIQFLFTSCRLGFLHRPNLLTHTSCPLDIYIIPQFSMFVKPFLKKTWKKFFCLWCDLNAHHPVANPTKGTDHREGNTNRTRGVAHTGESPPPRLTLCLLYLYYNIKKRFCQPLFKNFFYLFHPTFPSLYTL